jgi:hypothetical protein
MNKSRGGRGECVIFAQKRKKYSPLAKTPFYRIGRWALSLGCAELFFAWGLDFARDL